MAITDPTMLGDFSQGVIDNSYIQLMPNRGGVIPVPPLERLDWPTYAQAERHQDDSMIEAMLTHVPRPKPNYHGHLDRGLQG